MRLILTLFVKKLGKAGDEVVVKDGFGRYLIGSKSALRATPENLEVFKQQKELLLKKQNETLELANRALEVLSGLIIRFIRASGRDGRLFGSVSKKDIATEASKVLSSSLGTSFIVSNDQIFLDKPIKESGVWNVNLSLHHDLPDVSLSINVAGSEELADILEKKAAASS